MDGHQLPVEVIMRDGAIAKASEVINILIASEVKNTIKENRGEFDLSTVKGVKDASEAIAYYLEIVTGEKVKPNTVITELSKQLMVLNGSYEVLEK